MKSHINKFLENNTKKMLLLFVAAGMVFLAGCEGPEGPPGTNVEAEVFELRNVNFNSQGNYGIFYELDPAILEADMILIYRLTGVDGGAPVWQLIPQTYYPAEGEIDFNYDFTMYDINIYLEGTYDLALTPEYTQNQDFRVVIIPGYGSNFRKKQSDYNDYDAVMQAFHLKESDVKVVNMNN